jgi:hypothetical protein
MARFGLYQAGNGQCLQLYEGDEMKMNKEFVEIYKDLPGNKIELVASVRLDKGQSVIKMPDKSQ